MRTAEQQRERRRLYRKTHPKPSTNDLRYFRNTLRVFLGLDPIPGDGFDVRLSLRTGPGLRVVEEPTGWKVAGKSS